MSRKDNNKLSIYFYYPKEFNKEYIPECNGEYRKRLSGNYIWTVKTYGYLSLSGYECYITDTLPSDGVIITHRDFLPNNLKPNRLQLFVCIVADTYRHPYSQLHIVQNPNTPMVTREYHKWPSFFIPHWSESALRVRDCSRGDRFENISYFGSSFNLAPQLRSKKWKRRMKDAGFSWEIKDPKLWNDYSDTDAIIAVRSFGRIPYYKTPATKLYNAWTAGVPAIMGYESSCRAERRNSLDYIEVANSDEIIRTLIKLREDKEYRAAVIQNGLKRAEEVRPAKTTERWINIIKNEVVPVYHKWCEMSDKERDKFFLGRRYSYKMFKAKDFFDSCHRHVIELINSF